MIKNIVTSMVMEQLFQSTSDITDQKLREYWNHATEVSQRAIVMASQYPHMQPDQAMLAGLIHDIGVLPIIALAEDYPHMLVDNANLSRLISQAHLEIGTAILKHWCFGDELVAVVAHHENLQYDHDGPPNLVDLIIVCNLLSEHKADDLATLKNLKAIPAFHKLGITAHPDVLAKSA
jgi:HD-like signal output (HDOD) protein